MTREALILDLCPTDCIGKKCETYDCEDVCYPMLRIMFDKYDKQIRADAIDDFARNIMNALSDDMDMEYICKDIVFLVSKVAEQLKEKNECG